MFIFLDSIIIFQIKKYKHVEIIFQNGDESIKSLTKDKRLPNPGLTPNIFITEYELKSTRVLYLTVQFTYIISTEIALCTGAKKHINLNCFIFIEYLKNVYSLFKKCNK